MALPQSYILRSNSWEIKDGASAVMLIVFLLCILIPLTAAPSKPFPACAAPQPPLLNLQLRRGCLSGHGDEEEGAID